jgi:hypothetical protein
MITTTNHLSFSYFSYIHPVPAFYHNEFFIGCQLRKIVALDFNGI